MKVPPSPFSFYKKMIQKTILLLTLLLLLSACTPETSTQQELKLQSFEIDPTLETENGFFSIEIGANPANSCSLSSKR